MDVFGTTVDDELLASGFGLTKSFVTAMTSCKSTRSFFNSSLSGSAKIAASTYAKLQYKYYEIVTCCSCTRYISKFAAKSSDIFALNIATRPNKIVI